MRCPICDSKPMNCDCTPEQRRMHAEIEELEDQVPRWIPASERRPEVGQLVLTIGVNPTTCPRVACFVDGFWFEGLDNVSKKVTHWMPMPAPPTDSK